MLINNLLPDHVGLPHILDRAFHLVNYFGQMSRGDHSETLLLLALSYESTPLSLKVMGDDFTVSPWSGSFFFLFWGTFITYMPYNCQAQVQVQVR